MTVPFGPQEQKHSLVYFLGCARPRGKLPLQHQRCIIRTALRPGIGSDAALARSFRGSLAVARASSLQTHCPESREEWPIDDPSRGDPVAPLTPGVTGG